MSKTVEEKQVARLKVEGLREMILHILTGVFCQICLRDHYLMIKEQAVVSCLRCNIPACDDCYTQRSSRWQYMCSPAPRTVVSDDMVARRLED